MSNFITSGLSFRATLQLFNHLSYRKIVFQSFNTSTNFFAGHSHWQNVRHIKEAKDQEKNRLAAKYSRLIKLAVKDGGGSKDPKVNGKLSNVLDSAKAQSVPLATLKRILEQDATVDPYCIEVQGPGGIFILIESCNKNIKNEKERITGIAKKYNLKMPNNTGQIKNEFFNHQGSIIIKGFFTNHDEALEAAIDCGATDVEEIDHDSEKFFKFICEPSSISKMKDKLEKQFKLDIFEANEEFVPKATVQVTEDTNKMLDEFYGKIRLNLDSVDRFFDNIEVVGGTKASAS